MLQRRFRDLVAMGRAQEFRDVSGHVGSGSGRGMVEDALLSFNHASLLLKFEAIKSFQSTKLIHLIEFS